MQTPILSIEPTYRVVLPEATGFHLVLVGVGGTGANLALILGRLAWQAREEQRPLRLTFIDPDTVEAVNLGRQPFSPAELGYNKAVCLATRLNMALGLAITAIPTPFDPDWLRRARRQGERLLLVGCVDNYLARRTLAEAVTRQDEACWAIDCGNGYHSGQVLVGNLAPSAAIRLDDLGLCSGLPAPYVQEPTLLEPDPDEPAPACAEGVPGGEQSLLINAQVAAVAGQLCQRIFFERQIRQMAVHMTLDPPAMKATPLTATTLAPYLAVDLP